MIKSNKIGLFFFVFLISFSTIKAQDNNDLFSLPQRMYFAKQLYTSDKVHSDILPVRTEDLSAIHYDSILTSLKIKSSSKSWNYLSNENLFEKKSRKLDFTLNPILSLGSTLNKNNDFSEGFFGFNTHLSLRHWDFHFDYAHFESSIKNYDYQIISGWGYAHPNSFGSYNNLFQGYADFHPGKVVGLELGYGKTFIGYGYRSVLFSDNAANYPYFKLTAKIWHLKYTMLIAQLQDVRFSDGYFTDFTPKYMAMHYLSWDVTKWLSGGFFESIIWQAKDGNITRNFEPNYLNPVIFYRPVEFSQGSADNALIGINLKFKPFHNLILYQQSLFDEFLLKQLKAGNGWWANKFGLQFGLRYFDVFGLKNLQIQAEVNLARPYTYSYTIKGANKLGIANYASFSQPLADPLGANFYEYILRISYFKKRFSGLLEMAYNQKGFDENGEDFGGNVYDDYQDRFQAYGNYILQGNLRNELNLILKFSYLFNPKWNTNIFIGYKHQNQSLENPSSQFSDNYVFFGIKTAIMNRYFDY